MYANENETSSKHDILYAQHLRCQASEGELFVKTVNDLKLLKAVTLVHLGYLAGF